MPRKSPIPTELEDLLTPKGKRVLAGNAPGICGALAERRHRLAVGEGEGGRDIGQNWPSRGKKSFFFLFLITHFHFCFFSF